MSALDRKLYRLRYVAGWRPHAVKLYRGVAVEAISYPWAERDGRILCNVCILIGDPTSMVAIDLSEL